MTSVREDTGSIPGLPQWVRDPGLLWLWCKPAAVALIRLLAWEPPYAEGVALKKQEKKNTALPGIKQKCDLYCFMCLFLSWCRT